PAAWWHRGVWLCRSITVVVALSGWGWNREPSGGGDLEAADGVGKLLHEALLDAHAHGHQDGGAARVAAAHRDVGDAVGHAQQAALDAVGLEIGTELSQDLVHAPLQGMGEVRCHGRLLGSLLGEAAE